VPDRRRYRLDATVERHGSVIVGGSPLKLFRITAAGIDVVDRIASGDPVEGSALVTSLLQAGAIHPLVPVRDEPDSDRAGPTADDVTVVVPTLGAARHAPPGAIIVDDGSQPPVPEATLRLERNQGPAGARNAGLALVTTDLVAFVDSDVELADGWLDALLPHFADERVALVAPRVASRAGGSSLARYERTNSPLDLGADPARVQPGSRVGYVPGAAIVCRADAVRGIGGFDTSLRFGEDVDLGWRLLEADWRCRYEPESTVHHAPRSTWREWARQRVGYGSSAAPLARRHPGALAPLRMSGWSLGAWLLAVAGHPIVGGLVGAGSAAALPRKLRDVPARNAFRLGALGNLRAGEQIASAIRRAWWPLIALAALRSRAARRALVGSLLAVRNPIQAADDVAYSVGVWRGMLSERTLDPIVPEISSWPPRSRVRREPPGAVR
jgi:mycofactocin system glycosyltransferase